jgi:drug/metabolite transporter (DMT)-like permease
LIVALGVVADSHQRVATAVVAVVVALIIAAVTVAMITGAYRGARIHPVTLGTAGALYIVGFIALVVGASLVVAFSLQAGHGPFPGTIGTLVAAALLIVGGPILMASLRRSMMERATQ